MGESRSEQEKEFADRVRDDARNIRNDYRIELIKFAGTTGALVLVSVPLLAYCASIGVGAFILGLGSIVFTVAYLAKRYIDAGYYAEQAYDFRQRVVLGRRIESRKQHN